MKNLCAFLACILVSGTMAKAQSLYISDFDGNFIEVFHPIAPEVQTRVILIALQEPQGLIFDQLSNLYVGNYGNTNVVKITPDLQGSLYATMGATIKGMAVGADGKLYVANGNVISVVDTNGVVSTFAAGGGLVDPQGIAVDGNGHLFVTNGNGTGTGLKYDLSNGAFTTFASGLNVPAALAFDADGSVYISSFFGGSILKYSTDGSSSSVFASGLSFPNYLAFDHAGDLYASTGNGILRITSDGTVSTYLADRSGGLAFAPIPEPAGVGLLAFGLAGAMLWRRRSSLANNTPVGA